MARLLFYGTRQDHPQKQSLASSNSPPPPAVRIPRIASSTSKAYQHQVFVDNGLLEQGHVARRRRGGWLKKSSNMASHISACMPGWLADWLPVWITKSTVFLYLLPGRALAMIHTQDSLGSLAWCIPPSCGPTRSSSRLDACEAETRKITDATRDETYNKQASSQRTNKASKQITRRA